MLDRNHLAGRIGAVFGKAAVDGQAVAFDVFAEEVLAAEAEEAVIAGDVGAGYDSLGEGEAGHVFAERGDCADGFVAWDHGILVQWVA